MTKPTEQQIELGTAALGRPQYINLKEEPTTDFYRESFKKKGLVVLNEAYKSGIRYFDTARVMGWPKN
jgi:aryl-alcohol dehydrogenase-like predicted oxidoreductase